LVFGTQAGGGATGCLGVSGGSTTVAFTAFGSGAGTPTIDVDVIPNKMGLDLAPQVKPGMLTRTSTVINTILGASASNVVLLNLQNRNTPRVFLKVGTLGSGVAFATLSDVIVTAAGLQLGSNQSVRQKRDINAVKMDAVQAYNRDPITGLLMFDFMESQNSDSAYPADKAGNGSQFQLVGDVATAANAYGIVMQEVQQFRPSGSLYTL
jgi:hypothetical protein